MNIADADPDAQELSDRLQVFFAGGTPTKVGSDLTVGISDQERRQHEDEELDQLLATMDDDPEIARCAAVVEEPTFERIEVEPALTPYDRARERIVEAQARCKAAEPGSDEYHRAMADLAAARLKQKMERDRAIDEGWRKRREIDVYRSGEGREEYNASRRKVRSHPNADTKSMTPEQRAQHDRDMTTKRGWVCKKRKAGWPDEKIAEALPGWWAQRLAKRTCA